MSFLPEEDQEFLDSNGIPHEVLTELASHVAPGPRTRREVMRSLRENPWSP